MRLEALGKAGILVSVFALAAVPLQGCGNPARADRIIASAPSRPEGIAPLAVELSAESLSYASGSGAVVIDPSAVLTEGSPESFAGGTVTVDIPFNAHLEDQLSIRNQGNADGEIGLAGADVSYDGVLIGVASGGTNGSTPLLISLNANATAEAVQALLRNIVYSNANSTDPSDLERSVRIIVTDGAGGSSLAATRTLKMSQALSDSGGIAARGAR